MADAPDDVEGNLPEKKAEQAWVDKYLGTFNWWKESLGSEQERIKGGQLMELSIHQKPGHLGPFEDCATESGQDPSAVGILWGQLNQEAADKKRIIMNSQEKCLIFFFLQ